MAPWQWHFQRGSEREESWATAWKNPKSLLMKEQRYSLMGRLAARSLFSFMPGYFKSLAGKIWSKFGFMIFILLKASHPPHKNINEYMYSEYNKIPFGFTWKKYHKIECNLFIHRTKVYIPAPPCFLGSLVCTINCLITFCVRPRSFKNQQRRRCTRYQGLCA